MTAEPSEDTPVVIAARRTPVGTAGRGLAGCDVVTLAEPVLRALADEVAREAGEVIGESRRKASRPAATLLANAGFTENPTGLLPDDVVLGNTLGPGGNPARVAALRAGFDAPGLTVDRQCGSGLEAVDLAAAQVRCGANLVFAGGVESASTAPWRMRRPSTPTGAPEPYARAPFSPREIGDPDMGEAAESVASLLGIDRVRQDAYAARSHELTCASAGAGVFTDELVEVAGARIRTDERPRRITPATLARLRPAFVPGGTVTAGNSCGISDGAAVVAVVPERVRRAAGLPGLAIEGWATVGGDPLLPGACAAPAIEAVLGRAGVSLREVGALEITEAFAAQLLAATDALGLDPLGADAARVCAQGGAIALGHPWGASGALLVVRLFSRMVRADGPRFGVAACAVGGGQGVATLFRRVGPR